MGIAVGWFVEMGAHHEQEFVKFERLAQEEASLQPHAMKLPVMFAGDNNDGRMARAIMAAQDFVESRAIKVGQTNIKQDKMRMQAGNILARLLAVREEGELPVPVLFERILQKFGDIGIVFDDSNMPGRGGIMLKQVCLQEFVSHVHVPSGIKRCEQGALTYEDAHKVPSAHPDPPASSTHAR